MATHASIRGSQRCHRALRQTVVLLIAAATPGALGCASAAATSHGSMVNQAIAINVGSDERVARLAWDVSRTNRVPAFGRNTALARSSGYDLTTAAAAFQIVLSSRARGSVNVENNARATNQNCLRCDTVAIAYQFVVASDEDIKLSPGSRAELAKVHRDLESLLRSSAGGTEIVSKSDALASRAREILGDGLTRDTPDPRTLHAEELNRSVTVLRSVDTARQ